MEKEQNTAHETVEEKVAKAKASEEEKKAEKKDEKPEAKEGLNDSDLIDINKEEKQEEKKEEKKDEKSSKRGLGGKNAPKTTDDFIAKQKKRKKTKKIVGLIILAAVIIGVILFIRNSNKKKLEALAAQSANSIQTSYVEKKTLYDSKDATGTLYALESKTISRILDQTGKSGAEITAVNVGVGDHVELGDVLVEFSSENIEKSIAEAKEDIGTQKKLDAITAEDAQRSYINSYENAANSLQSAAETVDRKLEALYEACDAYGQAKKKRDEIKNDDELSESVKKTQLESAEAEVARTYQAQQEAQRAYDAAVEAQATNGNGSVSSVANSLSEADSTYKKAQINSGESVKKLQRQLNDSIDSLDDYVVYATISGVVTEVNVTEGNTFSSGNVLTIQDNSGYKADVLIDEYDIPKVKKAYEEKTANGEQLEVVVKTDATGDNEYKGHVTLIAPTSTSTATVSTSSSGSSGSSAASAATSSSSTANYKVSIELDEMDASLMIGMSAKVAIIVNESPENSLCVPYNCVEETEDGRYIVKVMDENGDKSTADMNRPSSSNMPGKSGSSDSDTKGVNGIVVENDADNTDSDKTPDSKKPGLLSKLLGKGDTENMPKGRKYREVEVEKIFDTDYYAAVVPKVDGSLKEGDEVMVATEKASGNDIMSLFGGMGGGPR